jgi:hypothetical protein
MLKEAAKIMKKQKFDFIITGEVLNERPMSQTYPKLRLIEKDSGLTGKLLRPLSAKALPETDVEKEGLVNRAELLSIQGRQRKEQFGLALRYNLSEFPTPAGGCLLCEKTIQEKLLDLFKHKKISEIDYNELALLKLGRHFRIGKTKIIVGRNKEENDQLSFLRNKNKILLEVPNCGSPITLLDPDGKKPTKREIEIAAKFTIYYSNNFDKNTVVTYWTNEKRKNKISVKLNEGEILACLPYKIG